MAVRLVFERLQKPCEIEVARLGAEGYTTLEIADQLHIGKRTVESHHAGAYSKLRIGSRAELIRMAAKLSVRWALRPGN